MSDASWQFRTTEGIVTVRSDAIVVHSRPMQFLAGQRARWRHGGLRERARTVGSVVGFLGIFYTAFRLAAQVESGAGQLLLAAIPATVVLYSFWREHARATTIPRSVIDTIALDEADRELTIEYAEQSALRSAVAGDSSKTALSLPSADDARDARQILRLRSYDVERAERVETVTEHRFVTRHGATFCPGCDRQVSPSDRTCGRCGTVLRYERPVGEHDGDRRNGGHDGDRSGHRREAEPERG